VFCKQCGNALTPGTSFCGVCGKEQDASPASISNSITGSGPPPSRSVPTSGMAIASLIFGILFFLLPSAILAIILGHVSLSEIKKSAGRIKGEGLAIAGLILGYMGIVCIPLILIIAAIAIPNLLRARMAANEDTAVKTVRLMVTAEITYQVGHPEEGYSCDLPTVVGSGDLNPNLAGGTGNGYRFAVRGCTSETPGGATTKFQIVAYPLKRNQTGIRAFCVDESGEIRFDRNGSPQACLERGEVLQ